MNDLPPYRVVEVQIETYKSIFESLQQIQKSLEGSPSPMGHAALATNKQVMEHLEQALGSLCKLYADTVRDART